jgi:riboflavin kinase/FMN adenylyltransferase
MPEMLTTLDERIRLLHAAGAEQVLVLPFTVDVSNLSPEAFIAEVIVETLLAKAVFVGENFRFGHRQSGDSRVLAALARKFDFHTGFLAPVMVRGEVVSSSKIREQIRRSEVSQACRLLGRPFAVGGPVVSGRGIGSKETVPTLNLARVPGLALPLGVFVSETFAPAEGRRWQSITNVGTRPTFSSDEVTIETYLLQPLAGTTPAAIDVRFRRFLRREQRFLDASELKSQILRDIGRADTYWRRFGILGR